jgi:hypothetical protein
MIPQGISGAEAGAPAVLHDLIEYIRYTKHNEPQIGR